MLVSVIIDLMWRVGDPEEAVTSVCFYLMMLKHSLVVHTNHSTHDHRLFSVLFLCLSFLIGVTSGLFCSEVQVQKSTHFHWTPLDPCDTPGSLCALP